MGQLDDSVKAQFREQRPIVKKEPCSILSARHDDRRVLRQMEQGAGIDVIVVIVGQEHGGWFREQSVPDRRQRRFGKPRQEPWVEEEGAVPLPVKECCMSEMHDILILNDVVPMSADGSRRSSNQTAILVERLHHLGQQYLRITRHGRQGRPEVASGMGSVKQTEQFSYHGPQRPPVKSDGNRVVIDRMKNAETTINHRRGLGRIGLEFPVKGPIRLPSAADVLFEVWPRVDQLCIGILQPSLSIDVIERCPFRKDVADGSIDRTGKEAMSLVEAVNDLRSDSAYEGEGTRRLCTLQLHPAPGSKAQVMILGKAGPDLTHGNQD